MKETTTHKGTGIGLAIARSLTELHKGTLTLKEPENGMNIFILELYIKNGENSLKLIEKKQVTKSSIP